MTGRVWARHQIRTGDWEFGRDGRIEVFISIQGDQVEQPSYLAQKIGRLLAEHHGDTVAGRPGIDWSALGWDNKAEHDAHVSALGRTIDSWKDHRLGDATIIWVNGQKMAADIPQQPPYSVTELDALDRIITRAPAIVAQDLAAEGFAA